MDWYRKVNPVNNTTGHNGNLVRGKFLKQGGSLHTGIRRLA
jgi:hypothetical protein